MTIICVGWRKLAAATGTSIPNISTEEYLDGFLHLVGSCAKRICNGRADC
jgi:hypothetical protein